MRKHFLLVVPVFCLRKKSKTLSLISSWSLHKPLNKHLHLCFCSCFFFLRDLCYGYKRKAWVWFLESKDCFLKTKRKWKWAAKIGKNRSSVVSPIWSHVEFTFPETKKRKKTKNKKTKTKQKQNGTEEDRKILPAKRTTEYDELTGFALGLHEYVQFLHHGSLPSVHSDSFLLSSSHRFSPPFLSPSSPRLRSSHCYLRKKKLYSTWVWPRTWASRLRPLSPQSSPHKRWAPPFEFLRLYRRRRFPSPFLRHFRRCPNAR